MSGYGAGQYDDAEADRRFQEELRARHTSASMLGFTPRGDAGLVSSLAMDAAAAAAAGSYYARVGAAAHPYYAHQASPDAVAASLYARQRAAQYGYATNSSEAERAYRYAAARASQDHYPAYRNPQVQSFMNARYDAHQRQVSETLQKPSPAQPTASPALSTPNSAALPETPFSRASEAVDNSSPDGTSTSSPDSQRVFQTPRPARPSLVDRSKSEQSDGGDSAFKQAETPMDNDDGTKWFSGCVPLGLDDDKYWLSELQVYLRHNFAEAFGATEEDIAAPMHGRNKPIALGQVGIRCKHCKDVNPLVRGQQATSYPSLISGIYNSVQQMLRLHLDCCQSIPADIRRKIEQLKLSSSSRGGRKQYWIDAAKRLGLVDTPHGIHFGRDPTLRPLPPLQGPSAQGKKRREHRTKSQRELLDPNRRQLLLEAEREAANAVPKIDDRPLVFPEDEDLISDYLYLTLQQMAPCSLMEADRVGCYKTRKVGFPGLACRHCVGQAGCGRYFPASEASLSQTTTSQTIMNHVRNCRRVPMEIRENLEIMKRARMIRDGKKHDKPKHGGRKVFFHRLWCRIQGLPIADSRDGKSGRRRKAKVSVKKTAKKKPSSRVEPDLSNEEQKHVSASDSSDDDSAMETSSEESSDEGSIARDEIESKVPTKNRKYRWFNGCVRLTKSDDSRFLPAVHCFARSELVEVYSYDKKDGLEGYAGRKTPAVGQVGVRCIFCKNLPSEEKPTGCIAFPDDLSTIQSKVADMIRLHFHSCPAMPDDTKEKFKAVRSVGLKPSDEGHQFWIDAARDIGICPIPPGGAGVGWGLSFSRNPLDPSPCDDLDREEFEPDLKNGLLVRPGDRDKCTDQMILLMRQVRACTFQKRDRRAGPGSRGRDRVVGFPGLCCKWCGKKSNNGRYFPVTAKNLTDNTMNSLMSHMVSCGRCPETIRASLEYLGHRSRMQKGDMSGHWKKSYCKEIWDRLHVERAWASEIDSDDEIESESSNGEDDFQTNHVSGDVQSESDEEDIGESMRSLIKAAAIWLTEQDQQADGVGRGTPRSARGRSLPTSSSGKRSPTPSSKGKDPSSESSKRRRVHF